MPNIKNWSTTSASNANADADINWAEGMPPSGVNDSGRAMMAAIRTDYENREWRDFGHTVTYASATTFTIPTDVTAIYTANRPIRCTDATTLYGYVSSSSYSAPNTTVTVTLDSGSLSASLASVALGFDVTNQPIHSSGIRGGAIGTGTANTWTATQTLSGGAVDYAAEVSIASASTVNIGAAASNNVYITGTTTITAFDTVSAGITRKVRFAAALTLTHNGTSLILPGSANITTAANDCAEFESLGSGNWVCTQYKKANGTSVVNGFTQSLAGNGYTKFPNGLIINWGAIALGAGGTGSVTFALGFPSAVVSIAVQQVGTRGGAAEANTSVTALSTTGATIYSGATNSETFYYIALGY